MGSMDFYVDFNVEVPDLKDDFDLETERRLRDLASNHSDLIGASVSLEQIADGETPHLFQVRIVVYKRPQDIAVVEKESEPMTALRNALDALEEKVRQSRQKLAQGDPHQIGDIKTVSYELSPEEVYATYAKNQEPKEILRMGRTRIASRLMVEEDLNQEAAYFAADQIIQVAEENVSEGK